MKKINLKDVKNSLKRDEMRAISGGCGRSSTPECGEECSSDSFCSGNSSCSHCHSGKCDC